MSTASEQKIATEAYGNVETPWHRLRAIAEADSKAGWAASPDGETDETIQEFTTLRHLAEKAATPPLGTLFWVRHSIEQGDQARRRAEDLLFLNRFSDAGRERDIATEKYNVAIRNAEIIDKALALRNRLMADLPALANWAAFHTVPPDHEGIKNIVDEFNSSTAPKDGIPPEPFEQILNLFRHARDLDHQLRNLTSIVDALPVAISADRALHNREAEFTQTIDELESSVNRIDHALRAAVIQTGPGTEIVRLAPDESQIERWWAIVSALRWPYLTHIQRQQGESKLFELERDALSRPGESVASASPPDDPSKDHNHRRDRSLAIANWHRLWALNVLLLGSKEKDDSSTEVDRKLDELKGHWSDKDWPRFDKTCRVLWMLKREAVNKGCNLKDVKEKDTQEVRKALVEADLLARTLHPYDARLLGDLNPAAMLQQFQAAQLCLFNAERYLDDFYAGNKIAGGPADSSGQSPRHWFAIAADECISAAIALNGGKDKDGKFNDQLRLANRISELQGVCNVRSQIVFQCEKTMPELRSSRGKYEGKAELKVVINLPNDDKHANLAKRVFDDAKAVFQLQPDPAVPLSLTLSPEDSPNPPHSRFLWESPDQLPYTFLVRGDESQIPRRTEYRFQSRFLFRGHSLKGSAEDNQLVGSVGPNPANIVKYESPSGDPVAKVMLKGEDPLALMLVVDWSGSMKQDLYNRETKRWRVVSAAVRDFIDGLAKHRPNTRVGLVVFGDRRFPEERRLENYQLRVNPAPASEAKGTLLGVLADLEAKGPQGYSPILGAIEKALDESTAGTAPKVIVVSDLRNDESRDSDIESIELQDRIVKSLQNKNQNYNGAEVAAVVCYTNKTGIAMPRKLAAIRTLQVSDTGEWQKDKKQIVESLNGLIEPQYSLHRIHDNERLAKKLEQETLGNPITIPADSHGSQFAIAFRNRRSEPFEIEGHEYLVFSATNESTTLLHVPYPPTTDRSDGRGDAYRGEDRELQRQNSQPWAVQVLPIGHGKQNRMFEVSLDRGRAPENWAVMHPRAVSFEVYSKETQRPPEAFVWQLTPGRSIPTWTITIPKELDGREVNRDWTATDRVRVDARWTMDQSFNPDIVRLCRDVPDEPRPIERSANETELIPGRRLNLGKEHVDHREVRFHISIQDWTKETASADATDALRRLNVSLANEQGQQDLTSVRELIEADGTLRVKFTVPANTPLDNWKLCLTSWKSQQQIQMHIRAE
jgi:hypothetical protein